MGKMFWGASAFNQPIGAWNTEKVNYMGYMFDGAGSFNQPIGAWNTGNVTDMSLMFSDAKSFNQPIANWNIENVNEMNQMFDGASSFNQPLGSWNISGVEKMQFMFSEVNLCTYNYDNLLNGWANQVVQPNVEFDGGGSKYSAVSEEAIAKLKSKGWLIFDGGQGVDNAKCPQPTGVEVLQQNTHSHEIEIYPNPSLGLFTVSGQCPLSTVRLYNSVGTLVYEATTNELQQIIDLTGKESGLYLLKTSYKSANFIIE